MKMTWKEYEEIQRKICTKYNAKWMPTPPDHTIGLATHLEHTPIYGIRYRSGWFIWSGEYSDADDFFQPVCAAHLVDYYPKIIHYLGLAPGWAFIINRDGYEDVWFDEQYLTE